MTARDFLASASELNQQIHYKEIELKSLRDLASGVSGCNFGEHLSGTRNPDPPFVRYTDKALALEKEIQNDKCKLSALKYSIEKAIDGFENTNERTVLRYKYLMFFSWKEISAKMGYSKRWVIKLHEKAIQSFSENWTPQCTAVH